VPGQGDHVQGGQSFLGGGKNPALKHLGISNGGPVQFDVKQSRSGKEIRESTKKSDKKGRGSPDLISKKRQLGGNINMPAMLKRSRRGGHIT